MTITSSTSSNSSQSINQTVPTSTSSREVHDKFTTKVLEVMREITKDNERRLQNYSQNPLLLNEGFYYPNEYYYALKSLSTYKASVKAKLNWLRERGDFFHGHAAPNFFSRPRNYMTFSGFDTLLTLRSDNGNKPSEALKAMRVGLTLLGCGEAIQFAYYEGIREVLGDEKFDMLFAADSSTPLNFKLDAFGQPDKAFNKLVTIEQDKKIVKGKIYHFQNVSDYGAKHKFGEAKGYNTVCCDDTEGKEKFIALGFNSEGMTKQEVNQKLLKEYNSEPTGMEILPETVVLNELERIDAAKRLSLKDAKKTMEDFISLNGGIAPITVSPKIELITQLANSTLTQARAIFDKENIH